MERSDGEVIARSLADPAGFEEVFRRHFDRVFGYLARRVGGDVAEDLAAQTFVEAFRSRARFDPSAASAVPWLFGIATNLLRHHRRSEARGWAAYARTGIDPHSDDFFADDTSARADSRATGPRIAAALAALPPGDRDTLLLYAWGGLSYDDIALALGVPTGTVRSRLHRTRGTLRTVLDDVWKEVHDG